MLIILFALVDVHTLFVLLFADYLSTVYVLSGSTLAIIKGMFFYIPFRNLFSLLDIIVGLIMLFLLLGNLWSIFWWPIFLFLVYKIVLSFAAV